MSRGKMWVSMITKRVVSGRLQGPQSQTYKDVLRRRIVLCFIKDPQVAFDRICLLLVNPGREPIAVVTFLRLRYFWINSFCYVYLER
jgi:hypothetical protein